MSNIFTCLYLDEDVNLLVADLLQARGFDVITARDAGQLHATDAEQLAFAVSQVRTLATHNRTDFEELVQSYFDLGQTHYGVIFAVRRPPQEIAQDYSLFSIKLPRTRCKIRFDISSDNRPIVNLKIPSHQ